MQIAQPPVSAKYGTHLSKSTYHFLAPRTIAFSSLIAPGGQSIVQRRHVRHTSSTPASTGCPTASGKSVATVASLKFDRTPAR